VNQRELAKLDSADRDLKALEQTLEQLREEARSVFAARLTEEQSANAGTLRTYDGRLAKSFAPVEKYVAAIGAKAIDRSFDPTTSLRALQFYGDGTLNRVPPAMQKDLTRWAQAVDLSKLPVLHPRRGLSPGGLER
jgi:hypothetical protein